jgi:hypothetical protein
MAVPRYIVLIQLSGEADLVYSGIRSSIPIHHTSFSHLQAF